MDLKFKMKCLSSSSKSKPFLIANSFLNDMIYIKSSWVFDLHGVYKIMEKNFEICTLTLNLLTTTIVAPPSNASKWQMGFNSAFKGLIRSLVNICL